MKTTKILQKSVENKRNPQSLHHNIPKQQFSQYQRVNSLTMRQIQSVYIPAFCNSEAPWAK